MLRFIWNLMLGAWLFSRALSQDVSFNASVDRSRLAMGEQFEITFMLSGSNSGTNFRPPSFSDFLVLSGPNQSTSMQFINGVMSGSVSYSYVLQARSEGKFTIGSATIEYNGKTLQTQPITIEVTKGTSPTKKPTKAEETDIGRHVGENLFLKVEVDKPRIYQGEQTTATYKLYTRVSIVNYGVAKVPSLTGFWSEDLEVSKQIQLTSEVINGKQYRVGILKKVALFPQRSGTLEIDPMEVECVIQMQTRKRSFDFFDQFFNDPFFGNVKNVNYKIGSESLKITVLPLPQTGIPANFRGAVGKYSMEAWLDKIQIKTNEPVTLKVKISGRGNLKLLEAPLIAFTDLEHYDPKISDSITKQGNLIAGSRTFEYLLIPRHPGVQRIPSFPLSYFDVEKKTYLTLHSPEFTLTVERGSELTATPISGLSQEQVRLLGEDIRFIKSGDVSFHRGGERLTGSAIFYILSTSPVLAFIGFLVFMKRREKVLGDVLAYRYRRARKMARRRLAEAKNYLAVKKTEEFYTEVSRALWGYLADKLGVSQAELSTDSLRASLALRGVPEKTVAKFTAVIEQCEYARFAPGSDSLHMDTLYNNAVNLILTIEHELR